MFDSFSCAPSVRERSRTSAACSLGRGYWAAQFSMSRACRLARAYGRFAWQAWGRVRPGESLGIVLRGCEIVAGAGNPWISGRKLGQTFRRTSWQADAGPVHGGV